MAGYRPKNLDELNNMFDKTLAAERAIKKGTSLVEKTSENATLNNITEDIERIAEEVKQSMGISEEINDFIAKFSYDKPEEEKAEAKPKPQMTVLVPEQKPEKSSFELFENNAEAETPVPAAEQETPKADRSDLMDEYMRIMNDEEDDEVPQKKLSRKEKKKLKMMEKREAEKAAQQKETTYEPVAEPYAEPVAEPTQKEETENFYDISDENTEDNIQPKYAFEMSDEEEFKAPEYITLSTEADEAQSPLASDTADNDFEFPQDYTPVWMKEEKDEETAAPKKVKKEKQTSNNILAKGFLSLLLAILVFIGSTATVFKTLIPVNTGKAANDTFYFFTAYKDYDDLEISKGDLIITEKRYTQDGDIFAYVDYSNKTFEFGRRNDSITNDDGVVLLVTENQGSRTLVSRDDCKGVIYAVYPTVGTFISILSDNFIVIIAAVAVSALVIILTLALGFRSKSKKTKTKSKSTAEKETELLSEEPEIEELEEIDLFTTIG